MLIFMLFCFSIFISCCVIWASKFIRIVNKCRSANRCAIWESANRCQQRPKLACLAEMAVPKAVVVLCGKRKSGKDHIAAELLHMIGSTLVWTIRLSKPIKAQYAKDHNLDVDKLMDSSPYKETYRSDMIVWSEAIRQKDAGYFCRLAVADANPACPVWLICDARRLSDMQFFMEHHGGYLLTVRVHASEHVRRERGWVPCKGVDDAPSECGLDNYHCDITIDNTSHNPQDLALQLNQVTAWIKQQLTEALECTECSK